LGDPKGGALASLGLQRTSIDLSNQNSTTTHSTNGYALASIPANAKMTRSNLIGTRTKKQIPRHSEGLDLVVASPWSDLVISTAASRIIGSHQTLILDKAWIAGQKTPNG
jgi:hypothetical protein